MKYKFLNKLSPHVTVSITFLNDYAVLLWAPTSSHYPLLGTWKCSSQARLQTYRTRQSGVGPSLLCFTNISSDLNAF